VGSVYHTRHHPPKRNGSKLMEEIDEGSEAIE